MKWDATSDKKGKQGGWMTVTGQATYQKVRCRRIFLNPLCLAATVLGLKLTWFRLNLEREIQNFKSVIGSDQRDSREML